MAKYQNGDLVTFYFDTGKEKIKHHGYIEIVDPYGTFEQDKEPSYDIMIPHMNTLFKHVVESDVYPFEGEN